MGTAFAHERVNIQFYPLKFKDIFKTQCLVIRQLPIVTNTTSKNLDLKLQNEMNKLQLADPTFYQQSCVDLIIGANLFWSILLPDRIHVNSSNAILQNTRFGWIVANSNSAHTTSPLQPILNFTAFQKLCDIHTSLEKFWQVEDSGVNVYKAMDECEALFSETTKKSLDGKFIVQLPFKEDPHVLGDSYKTALRRFYSLENKLKKNEKLRKMYSEFLKEYESLGHMTKLVSQAKFDNPAYYIPHLGVLDESRLTTKLRVVFDASARTTSGKSLNNILRVGPTIQDTLFTILIRFREYPIVMCADATKMYRQVWIQKNQRRYQRILWRSDSSSPISIYELNTVTYGTAPAMFLAVRSLQETAYQHKDQFPSAAESILSDFYVDDYLSGGDNLDEVRRKKQEVEKIVATGNFNLRKWVSSDPNVFGDQQTPTNEPFYFNTSEEIKTLGIQWRHKTDEFSFKSVLQSSPESISTKRNILSESSKLFDPLGFVSPIVVRAKLILQQLWQLKIEWDEKIPQNLSYEWENLKKDFVKIQNLKISRHLNTSSESLKVTLHGFSDASPKAYGACIYLVNETKSYTSSLLVCSKSRVAPLKIVSLPRLELRAALLLTNLMKSVVLSMRTKATEVHLWTDACITLCWIEGDHERWTPYVANRTRKISDNVREYRGCWHYVPSKQNPADVISRGTCAEKLISSKLWWNGPTFLTLGKEKWPKVPTQVSTQIPEEKEKCLLVLTAITIPLLLFDKFNSLYKILRVLAYCLRFMKNLKLRKNKCQRKIGYLSVTEIESSLMFCVKTVQINVFPDEIQSLKLGQDIKNSSVRSLHPFLDTNGILRVGGRLHNSADPEYSKHPVLLPAKHQLNNLIFLEEHLRLGHGPTQLLLSSVRRKFWPVKGILTAKRIVKKCILCQKARPRFGNQVMGPLPASRVTVSHPFSQCSVDYTGPINIKSSNRKNSTLTKAYFCLFVCFVTKAVHIEIVTSLSSKDFLHALQRFIGRRGIPAVIYSDNSKTFTGAHNILTKIVHEIIESTEISTFFGSNRIEWKFAAPYSPHLGGLHEAAIKSFKRHFYILAKANLLTIQEAETIAIQIEGILNSRPLMPLSSDPYDFEALSPGHFLIGKPIMMLPFQNGGLSESRDLKETWKIIQQITQQFWNRWKGEYLQQLQKSVKWHKDTINFEEGSLVIIKNKYIPPTCWKMARIIKLKTGVDGKSRIAVLRTATGTTTRAITELCPL